MAGLRLGAVGESTRGLHPVTRDWVPSSGLQDCSNYQCGSIPQSNGECMTYDVVFQTGMPLAEGI